MSHFRLRGVAETLAHSNLCTAQIPLIQEADRLAASGDVAGAVAGYVAAAQAGCPSAMLGAAVNNVVSAASKPSWAWLAVAAGVALGTGILIGRATKRGRR